MSLEGWDLHAQVVLEPLITCISLVDVSVVPRQTSIVLCSVSLKQTFIVLQRTTLYSYEIYVVILF